MNQQTPNSFIRAVRGPVLLIVLGVLFALGEFTSYGFGQTWPVLLIVLGLLKFLEVTASGRGGASNTEPWRTP